VSRACLLVGLLGACAPPAEERPVPALDEEEEPVATLEVAPPGGGFGDLQDGAVVWCGIPPQGGAPYTPLMFRLWGPEVLGEGIVLDMWARDLDGTELGYTSLTMGLVQANVGENAGAFVGAEAHLRYEGAGLEELAEREVILSLQASALEDPSVVGAHSAQVTLVLGL
jgi:hypothetical protein